MHLLPRLQLLAFALPWASATAPCRVKAWVRADDLAPNHVSLGELKIKIVQPCAHAVESVALRLRLDEYAEEALKSNTTAPSPLEETVEDLWDWRRNAGAMVEWTTTTHKRTAWVTEETFTIEDTSASEWVLPFSVVSPNVNFPAAITPLLMRRSMDGRREKFGRGYRYSTLVKFSGSSDTVDISAGFTAFMPTSRAPDHGKMLPEIIVEAARDNTLGAECPQDLGRGDPEAPDGEDTMRLRVVIEQGGALVQGRISYLNVTVLGGGDNSMTTYRTHSSHVERWISPSWSPSPQKGDLTSFHYLREIRAQMWKTEEEPFSSYGQPLPGASRLYVPAYIPCTVPTGPDAPFRVEAFLVISIDERRNAPHLDPLREYWNGITVSGAGRRGEAVDTATEDGWEFGACHEGRYHNYRYTARIPVTIVSPRHSDAVSYLDNDGRIPIPRILSGHLVQRRARTDVEFAIAEPVSIRETSKAATQSRDRFHGFGHIEAIDTGAGDYVGALWQSRLYREGAPSSHRPAPEHGQVVLQS